MGWGERVACDLCRPNAPRWRQALLENVPAVRGLSFEPDTSPIHEVLNVAWAGHEVVSDYMGEMFEFFARPGPDEAQLQPMMGVTMPKSMRGAGTWRDDRGLAGL